MKVPNHRVALKCLTLHNVFGEGGFRQTDTLLSNSLYLNLIYFKDCFHFLCILLYFILKGKGKDAQPGH